MSLGRRRPKLRPASAKPEKTCSVGLCMRRTSLVSATGRCARWFAVLGSGPIGREQRKTGSF